MVDEENAFEMVHLVLDAGGHQAFHVLFMRFAFEVLVAHTAGRGPVDIGKDVGDRKATFLIAGQIFRRVEDFGVDENPRFLFRRIVDVFVPVMIAWLGLRILVLGLEIDHQHALGHADLDRGKADAGRGIHRFEHVGDELVQFVVELVGFDLRRHGLEPGVRHFEDFADSHGE